MKLEIINANLGVIKVTLLMPNLQHQEFIRLGPEHWWKNINGILERMESCENVESQFQYSICSEILTLVRFSTKSQGVSIDSLEAAALAFFPEDALQMYKTSYAGKSWGFEGPAFLKGDTRVLFVPSRTKKDDLLKKHGINLSGRFRDIHLSPENVLEAFPEDNSGVTIDVVNMRRSLGFFPIETDIHHLEIMRQRGVVRCEGDKWYIVD